MSSCGLLARAYALKKNDKAMQYSQKGCMLNDSYSCMMTGALYLYKNNDSLAIEYLRKACLLKSDTACSALDQLTQILRQL